MDTLTISSNKYELKLSYGLGIIIWRISFGDLKQSNSFFILKPNINYYSNKTIYEYKIDSTKKQGTITVNVLNKCNRSTITEIVYDKKKVFVYKDKETLSYSFQIKKLSKDSIVYVQGVEECIMPKSYFPALVKLPNLSSCIIGIDFESTWYDISYNTYKLRFNADQTIATLYYKRREISKLKLLK